jgi:hypothetical protein
LESAEGGVIIKSREVLKEREAGRVGVVSISRIGRRTAEAGGE